MSIIDGLQNKCVGTDEARESAITRHGRPAGIFIGFDSEEAWFEYRLEHHPEFLARIQNARSALLRGEGARFEDLPV